MRFKLTNNQKWVILILTIILSFYLYFSGVLTVFINSLGQFQIIGVLISGLLFGYFFTAAPATASFISFTNTLNPLIISFIGATGVMIGDFVIFSLFKRGLPDEIESIIDKTKIEKLKKSKFKWLIPGIAGLIIASPLSDEIAIAFLGATKIKDSLFMLLVFILNFIGILILTTIAWLV